MSKIPKKSTDSYRLLHTADWHLGKLLNEQSRDDEHGRFLDWLLEVVKEHEVDAIILAGDVFDTANPPQSALTRYYDFVTALYRETGCQLAVIGGNHDSAAVLEAPKNVLRALNTHVTGNLPESPDDRILLLPSSEAPKVALAMVPFLRDRDLRVGHAGETSDEIRERLLDGIRQCYEDSEAAARKYGCLAIGTGHLTVVGASTSDSERDIHIGGLGAVAPETFPAGFSYVALGHLHRPQAMDAAGRVRYAGSPLPLSFSEASDGKEVRILDVSGGEIEQHSLPIPLIRRLSQIRTKYSDLEKDLTDFQARPGELTTWVEVVVEDATLETDLVEQVRLLTERRDFEVLKVLRGRSASLSGMSADDVTDDEAIETLLDQPARVFEHLLAQHEEFNAEEAEGLKAAFALLVDLDAQSETVHSS
jgi:exonuclease SbcD